MKAFEIIELATEWFNDNLSIGEISEDDYWVQMAGSCKKFYRVLKNKDADPIVDDCCMYIGVDETSDDRNVVESTLAKCAAAELKFA